VSWPLSVSIGEEKQVPEVSEETAPLERVRGFVMLRRFLARLFRPRSARADVPGGRVIHLSQGKASVRRACDAEVKGKGVEPTGLEHVSIEELEKRCDDYWDYLAQPKCTEIEDPVERSRAIMEREFSREATERYDGYVRAVNELGRRGPEIRDWARLRLKHPDYEAREMAAWWIGQLGARGQLEGVVEEVIGELRVLVNRPVGEENKERQAIGAAVTAIGKIGHPSGVAVLRDVLFSTEWYHRDDTKWNAAEGLGKLVGCPFMGEPDPVRAAQEWLRSHPVAGTAWEVDQADRLLTDL
jgi:hypothetical protein